MNTGDWTAIGACATAVMAVATFVLAWKTRAMATETQAVARATLKEAEAVERQGAQLEQQISLSMKALQASVQPWLVWEADFDVEDDAISFSGSRPGALYSPGTDSTVHAAEDGNDVIGWFGVRNVGNGLALLDMSKSGIYPQNGRHPFERVRPNVDTPVLPPGGTASIEFRIPASESVDKQRMTMVELAGGGGHELFAVQIVYGDALGEQETTARFGAHRPQGEEEWTMYAVEYRRPGGDPMVVRRYG